MQHKRRWIEVKKPDSEKCCDFEGCANFSSCAAVFYVAQGRAANACPFSNLL